MSRLSRRGMLLAAGTASVSLAGCAGITPSFDEPPRLGELQVQNWDPRAHAVQVLLVEDGEPVYWEATRVGPAEEDEPQGHALDGYPTKPGACVLFVQVDDQPRSNWNRLDFGEYDISCLGIIIDIGREEGDLVDILRSTEADICEDESTPT